MSLRVLLADESASIKKVFQLGLQDFAAEVKSVQSGVDVMEVAQSFQPHIVFADILLQKLNGYEVCLQIKQHPVMKDIPFVLMWSSFMELDQKKYRDSGAQGEIEKPFDVDAMRAQIQDLVPSVKDQHLGSFLKFPSTITQEFVEEEGQRTPSAVDGIGVVSIPPAPMEPEDPPAVESLSISPVPELLNPDISVSLPPEPLGIEAPGFETSETVESLHLEEDTSAFNNHNGEFEFETLDDGDNEAPTLEASVPPSEPSPLSAVDPMDITQWKVQPEYPSPVDSSPSPDVEMPFQAAPDSESQGLEAENLETEADDSWQSASLTAPASPVETPETSIDGFESVDIKVDDSEPLDLESFLYKPGEDEDKEDEGPVPEIANVVVRNIDGEPEDDDPLDPSHRSFPTEKLEKMVTEQVSKQLSSEGIENLVRAHAQEVIKLNIIEQIPQMIEKIAREELDKLLKQEIADASDAES